MIASNLEQPEDNSPLSLPGREIKTRPTAEAGNKKEPSYKPLPTQLLRDGFNYQQIARERDSAVYKQTWTGNSEATVCYEVILIRRREAFQIDGRSVEPAEVYPNSDAWGVDGFTFTDKDAAFAKLWEVAQMSYKHPQFSSELSSLEYVRVRARARASVSVSISIGEVLGNHR